MANLVNVFVPGTWDSGSAATVTGNAALVQADADGTTVTVRLSPDATGASRFQVAVKTTV